jgi:hypothetical protein
MRSPRMTTRRWMLAIAVAAVPLAAWDRVVETYDAYRFRKGWDTCDVTGEITAVNRQGERVTISIGADDGIVTGEVLYLFRAGPKSRYLGKVRVVSVECDSAVGQIVARARGLVQEGDGVAHLTWFKRHWPLCGYALKSMGSSG